MAAGNYKCSTAGKVLSKATRYTECLCVQVLIINPNWSSLNKGDNKRPMGLGGSACVNLHSGLSLIPRLKEKVQP